MARFLFSRKEHTMSREPVCTTCGSINWILVERTDSVAVICMNCGCEIEVEQYAEQIVA